MHGRRPVTEKTGRSSDNLLTRKWTILAILFAAPVFFLFAYFGEPGRGRAAGISAAVIIMAARLRWDLRKKAWFWITVAIITGYHIPLILLVSWTDKSYPGYTLLPMAVLDFAIMYGAIKLVEKAARARG
jgi:hypothetical protein